MDSYGTLYREDDTELRPATRDEWAESMTAGETGLISVDGDTVYVSGGPDAAIITDDRSDYTIRVAGSWGGSSAAETALPVDGEGATNAAEAWLTDRGYRVAGEWTEVTGWYTVAAVEADLVGVAEAARITGLSEASVRTYVARGTIAPQLPVAGSDALVWRRSDLEEWAGHERRPGPKGPRSTG